MPVGGVFPHLAVDEYPEAHSIRPSWCAIYVSQLRQTVHTTQRVSNAYRITEVLRSVSIPHSVKCTHRRMFIRRCTRGVEEQT
jgi:hypothetical protein